jgi:hypothetical protein
MAITTSSSISVNALAIKVDFAGGHELALNAFLFITSGIESNLLP